MVKDPVCGMDVNPITAKFSLEKSGETHYFCSLDCKRKFSKKGKTTIIEISGMHCASCVNKIETALKAVPGVISASVNFASSKANVDFDPNLVGESSLEEAITKTGYKVGVEKKSDPRSSKVAKCDGLKIRSLSGFAGSNPACAIHKLLRKV